MWRVVGAGQATPHCCVLLLWVPRLILRDNGLRNGTVELLSSKLVTHSSLCVLDVSSNMNLHIPAGMALLDLVTKNPNIRRLGTTRTRISEALRKKISLVVTENHRKRMWSGGGTCSGCGLWGALYVWALMQSTVFSLGQGPSRAVCDAAPSSQWSLLPPAVWPPPSALWLRPWRGWGGVGLTTSAQTQTGGHMWF